MSLDGESTADELSRYGKSLPNIITAYLNHLSIFRLSINHPQRSLMECRGTESTLDQRDGMLVLVPSSIP